MAGAFWILIPAAQRASGEWIDDTLRARVTEQGLDARFPLAGNFPRQRVEVIRAGDPWREVNELFYARGWTDGLPIVPPTIGRVDEMVASCGRPRNYVVAALDPLKGEATVEKIAINAVMAGCRAEYLPIVITVVEMIARPEFNLRGVQTTDENVAPLLIFSGPIVSALDINSGFGALGPGWQANATIGRAVRLIMQNIGGGWPAAVSLAGLGQPGRYSLCLAENAATNPWQPLHADLGFRPEASTVTLMRAETAINVTGGLEEIASVMRSAASNFSIMHGGRVAVALAPYVARQLADKGWSKLDVRRWLHEHGRVPVGDFERTWVFKSLTSHRWPAWVTAAAGAGAIPVVEKPDDITIVVAGGDLHIPQHAYLPTWGFPACRITAELVNPRA